MIEILPIRVLTDEDGPVFGKLAVALGKLQRLNFPVAVGFAVTAPEIHLRTVLEHFDFGKREVFEQSLNLVKKEIVSIPLPEALIKETKNHKQFLLGSIIYKSTKNLWAALLILWLEQIKQRLMNNGFYKGITENLDPQIVIFANKPQSQGSAYYDPLQDDVVIPVTSGKLHAADLKKIFDVVKEANKKLLIPHEYEWIVDSGVKISGIKQYTQVIPQKFSPVVVASQGLALEAICSTKVFLDSIDETAVKGVDGIYLAAKSYEDVMSIPDLPVYFKLTDKNSAEIVAFLRHKKGLTNIHIVLPQVRTTAELLQIKRDLTVKNLTRKNSLQIWMEASTPENIINFNKYLEAGIDGVVLNMDELVAFFNGFDAENEEEQSFYKNEVEGLLKFLEEPLKFLHKEKVPFIASGHLTFEARVLEYLVEKGVYGVVAPKYIAHSAKDLLYQVEKRMILRRT